MRIDQPRPLIGVGVVAMRDGKVLLGKRRGAHGQGHWSIPGGHLELGESVEECARRELFEEVGVQASSYALGPWVEDLLENNRHYISLFVFAHSIQGKPQLLEPQKCEGWKWFDWHELPEPLFVPFQSLIVKVGIDNLYNIGVKA